MFCYNFTFPLFINTPREPTWAVLTWLVPVSEEENRALSVKFRENLTKRDFTLSHHGTFTWKGLTGNPRGSLRLGIAERKEKLVMNAFIAVKAVELK